MHASHLVPAHARQGFGYLVPASERVPELGVIFDSCAFPTQDEHPGVEQRLTVSTYYPASVRNGVADDLDTVVQVMMGGHRFKETFGCGPDEVTAATLEQVAKDVVRERLGITEEASVCLVCVGDMLNGKGV